MKVYVSKEGIEVLKQLKKEKEDEKNHPFTLKNSTTDKILKEVEEGNELSSDSTQKTKRKSVGILPKIAANYLRSLIDKDKSKFSKSNRKKTPDLKNKKRLSVLLNLRRPSSPSPTEAYR